MKHTKIIMAVALLLSLCLVIPAQADLTPGHVDTGFDPGTGADNDVLAVAIQADGKVLVGGNFTTVDGTGRNRIARLNADGTVDTSFDPGTGADNRVRAVVAQTDGKVLIGGSFTTVNGVGRNYIARLNADGSLDTTFDPGTGFDNVVRTMVAQTDGKVFVGGDFDTVDGVARSHIVRLNADGSLDTTFDTGAGPGSPVYEAAVQADGKVVIVGNFTSYDGEIRNRVARLNADGSLDTTFYPGQGANGWVGALALQPDGKVLIGGTFATVGGVARARIARLNDDGSLDTTFDPGAGPSAAVYAIAVQADDKVLVGGAFSTIDGVARACIARLDADGSVDTSFDPGAGMDANVWAVTLQADGKALVGGEFTTVNGAGRNHIARLNWDGTLDVGLDPGTGANSTVSSVVFQPDGKALIGGYFTEIDGTTRYRIARLNADGSLDTSFAPSANSVVRAVTLQPNGKVLIGGFFGTVNGMTRGHIARLNASGSMDTSFALGTGANDDVYAVALQTDDKVLIGGDFTSYDGTGRNRIARLSDSGALDTGFDPGTGVDSTVYAIAIQPDDKVIIAGNFSTFNGITRNRIARLDDSGTLDTTFDPGVGPNFLVRDVAIQPDGKILIGGSFTTVAGVGRNYIARLNDDGTLDTSFNPGTGASSWVDAVALQPDGKVIIGGNFTTVDGETCNRIARLNAGGSVDTTFDTSTGVDSYVYDAAIQPDGKVLIGGSFTEHIVRINGATSPAITSGAPPSTGKVGEAYNHKFMASGYPHDSMFYVTGGSLPSGLTLDATNGLLSGTPTEAGNYSFTVSACNWVAPCATNGAKPTIAKGDTTTTITAHTPDPSEVGQAVTVDFDVTSAAGTPTGNVTVSDGTATCNAAATAGSCSLTFATAGTKALTATFAGDSNFNSSTSTAVSHMVNDKDSFTVYLPAVLKNYP